jgi:hypothetical protein
MIARRRVLAGLLAAPAVIVRPGLLMPVRRVMLPQDGDSRCLLQESWINIPVCDLLKSGTISVGDFVSFSWDSSVTCIVRPLVVTSVVTSAGSGRVA